MTPEAAFAAIDEALGGEPGVEEGTGFGTGLGLRVGGRIFAMLIRGQLVLKFPAPRCDQLIAAGAQRFERGKVGQPMREWVVLDTSGGEDPVALAREALAFVGSAPR